MSLFKKLKIFRLFLFSKIGQEIVFGDILEKKYFLDYKKKSSKISKNWDFFKWFSKKIENFQCFCFW